VVSDPRVDGTGAPTLVGTLVRALDEAPPYELAEVLHRELRATVRARSCTVLLADYSEQTLEPVPAVGLASTLSSQRVDGSAAGEAYREQRVIAVPSHEGSVLYLPITQRQERIGVLEVDIPSESAAAQSHLEEAARVLAYVIAAARRYTDRFERIRRRRELQLAAEMQWELLPVLAYSCPEYSLAGSLEPAYEIGGDTFDYAVAPTSVTLTITDAMGHGLGAAMLGSLAVSSMRNVRRSGGGIVDQATCAAGSLLAQFSGEFFVTGLLITIDVPAGSAALVNAGHVQPLLVRDGVATSLRMAASLPLGMFANTSYVPERFDLQPGDRLALVSDGILDAAPEGGEPYGDARLRTALAATRQLSATEAVRHLTTTVLAHRAGQLADDATAVVLDWHGADPAGSRQPT
jgi:serine phosphatase RsbU (regulator of sigma subunit)